MLRTATALALVSAASLCAAPVPAPSEKELLAKHWGKTEGQGEFELKGKQLTIRTATPPSRGLIGIIGGGDTVRITMPRVTRSVSGDFEATVVVTDAAPPDKNAKHEGAYPETRAGLLVEGGGYGIEFHLHQYHPKIQGVPKDEMTRSVWVDTWFPRGGAGNSLKAAETGKSTYLRVTRKEKAVSVSYSFDGKEWSAPYTPRKDLDFPDEVTVGVFLAHSTFQTLAATFDRFTVEPLNPKK
jgi:hypothetical protein